MLKNKGFIPYFAGIVVIAAVVGYMALNPPQGAEEQSTAPVTLSTPEETAASAKPQDEAPEEEDKTVDAGDAMKVMNDMNFVEKPEFESAPPVDEVEDVAEEQTEPEVIYPSDINAPVLMVDRVLGNPDAPVTIIEYASLTCSHCATFAKAVLPEVKAQLIDSGKAKLIFRDFPLDQYAMKAAMLARCAPEESYFSFLEVLFHNQQRWIKSKNILESLKRYGALSGMSPQKMDACLANEELDNYILQGLNDAQGKYGIRSTPAFIFNNGAEMLVGAQPVEKFVEVVNKLTPSTR